MVCVCFAVMFFMSDVPCAGVGTHWQIDVSLTFLYPMGMGGGVKLTTHLHVVPRSRKVELYLHSPIHPNNLVLNWLITGTTLPTIAIWWAHKNTFLFVDQAAQCFCKIQSFDGGYHFSATPYTGSPPRMGHCSTDTTAVPRTLSLSLLPSPESFLFQLHPLEFCYPAWYLRIAVWVL
jgi:hypothetical protein